MSEEQSNPSSGTLPEAAKVSKAAQNRLPSGENGYTSGKKGKSKENNVLPDERGPSLYSPSGEVGKMDLGRKEPRKILSDYEAAGQANRQQVHNDIKRKAALTSLYDVSYGHFKSMHARAKAEGHEVHHSWCGASGFARFLIDIGPIPQLDRSLDRKNCYDKEYGPDNVRWATPREQANNRKNTIMVYDPHAKECAPLTIVAERLGLSAKAIRHRLDRGANPIHVVADVLLDKGKRGKKAASDKRVLTPHDERERHSAVLRADIPPMPDRVPRINIKIDWPASLINKQRDQWNASHRANRRVINDDGEYEWRFEFFIRTLRGELAAAGFGGNMIGRPAAWGGHELDRMRERWNDPEEPTDAEWAIYAERADFFERCRSRLQEALAVLPEYEAEARQHRRERDRSYPRYGWASRANSYDYEDAAMKDAEAFGIDDDEGEEEAAPPADNWREDMARDWSAHRRRGMEL